MAWAFPYEEKAKPARADAKARALEARAMPEMSAKFEKLDHAWKLSAPVLIVGKVVFTAPDGEAIHCLNLKDGTPLWQAERKDEL